jgi:asparagine synthase (glutamine-hydrolysing)
MLATSPHRGSAVELRVCHNAVLGASNTLESVDSVISAEGDLSAVFSGKLDNAAELVQKLSADGFRPASTSPADIVVSAFRAFGPDAPNCLRGVFAGVITDGHQVWAFRDHLGLQPLFYADRPRGFYAATEVKQVITGAELPHEPDTETLERIFYARVDQNTGTAFKGVSRLEFGTTLAVNGKGASAPRHYWHPRRILETARITSYEDVKERFDELFQQAVARCVTGNDIVALSGGIDSPAVAGFAAPFHRQLTGRPLSALSLVFPDHPKVDERSYIELIGQSLGLQLHAFVPKARVLDDVAQWAKVLDGPIPYMTAPGLHEFYSEARRLGFRNILTGDIAECVVDLQGNLANHLLIHGRWRALMRLVATQRLKRLGTWQKLGLQCVKPFVPEPMAKWYLRARGHDFGAGLPDWVNRRELAPWVRRVPPHWKPWSAVQTMPLRGCPISMEGVEITGAVAGVTVRRPFADIDLWEFFLSLPAEIKYPDLRSKTLVRRLLRGRVPDKILDRRDKTVFNDHVMAQVDYPTLKGYLVKPQYRVRGVDYDDLATRLERQDLGFIDWIWAYDLARVHAFLSQW